MKILIIVPSLGNGGAERIATQLAIQQHKEGNQVTVLSYYTDYSFSNCSQLTKANVKIIYLDKKVGIDISLFKKVKEIVKIENPDIIQTHLDVLLYLLPVRKQLIFHTIHSVASYEATGLQKIVRIVAFKIKRVVPVAIGNTIRKSISEYYRIKENNIPVIYNGSALSVDYTCKYPKDTTIFCLTGSLAKVKNHKLALQAFSKIKEKGYSFKVFILGDGDLKNELEEMSKCLELSNNVEFLGYKSNVGEYLAQSDIYICCSRIEGISIAIIEAMHYGLPVIASNVGGNPDLVINGYNGLLFTDNDVDDFVKKIELILNNKELISKYSKHSYEESKKYTIEECSRGYINLYQELLCKKREEY